MEATPISQYSLLKPVPVSELGSAFRSFSHAAFRLELLPAYEVPSEKEAFSAFSGGKKKPHDFNGGWNNILRESKERQAKIYRVRLIEERTPYIDFEVEWAYKTSISYGEIIKVVTREHIVNAAAKAGLLFVKDFWLFDEKTLFVMNYDAFGRFLGVLSAPEDMVSLFCTFSSEVIEDGQEII